MCNKDIRYIAVRLQYRADEAFFDLFLISKEDVETKTYKKLLEESCIFYDIRSLGIGEKWISHIQRNATPDKEVQVLSGEDKRFLLCWIVCFVMREKNWFGREILRLYNDLDTNAVYEKLFDYIFCNQLDFRIRQIKCLSDLASWKNHVNKMQGLYLTAKRFLLKNSCRMVVLYLRIKAICFGVLYRNRTISELSKAGYSVVASFRSSAGNAIYKLKMDEDTYLAKGREDFTGASFENEKLIQTYCKSSGIDDSFVVAKDLLSDSIVYPYINGRTLDKLESMDESSVEALGDFLVNVVELLYQNQIIHRDLRPNNIMVLNGKPESYKVIDFGCSIIDHHDIWEKGNYMNRFRKERVCDAYKFSQEIVDDAASALAIYIGYGGNYNDRISRELKSKIGRLIYRQ